MNSWKVYNGAIIPNCVPHKMPNLDLLENGEVWKLCKKALFVRYVTDFDCTSKTNWWYTIKDTPFDVTKLKAKRRYEITKGNRFFDVREIIPTDYTEELFRLQVKSMRGYRDKKDVDKDTFVKEVAIWTKLNHMKMYAAFFKETNELCGYALTAEQENVIHLSSQKTDPYYEKYGVNAAIVNKILEVYNEDIKCGKYICDGARNTNHITNFQEYLEKYFDFRKAYCVLNIRYRRHVRLIVKLIYPFRKFLSRFDNVGVIHKINAVLKMEEFVRLDKNK